MENRDMETTTTPQEKQKEQQIDGYLTDSRLNIFYAIMFAGGLAFGLRKSFTRDNWQSGGLGMGIKALGISTLIVGSSMMAICRFFGTSSIGELMQKAKQTVRPSSTATPDAIDEEKEMAELRASMPELFSSASSSSSDTSQSVNTSDTQSTHQDKIDRVK